MPLPSATLGQALIRQALVYPLATLVVPGQWPVFARTPRLTRATANRWLDKLEAAACQAFQDTPRGYVAHRGALRGMRAGAKGMTMQPPERIRTVLFACVHNAGRSQIAASWFRALADRAKARAISAGTQPAPRIHPEVVTAMREVGISLGEVKPQLLTWSLAQEAQLLVTMGCNEECPVVPGLERIDWNLADPKGETLERVRAIRDELRGLVSVLINERGWGRVAFEVRRAREEDFPAVSRLLERAKLPLAGVREHWEHFLVAETSGQLLGAVGLEIYGRSGLLRSLVVDENFRSKGVGRALVASLNPLIRATGLEGLFLLTTTAAEFFVGLGFARISREQFPASLNASEELRGACPASAVAMAAKLNG